MTLREPASLLCRPDLHQSPAVETPRHALPPQLRPYFSLEGVPTNRAIASSFWLLPSYLDLASSRFFPFCWHILCSIVAFQLCEIWHDPSQNNLWEVKLSSTHTVWGWTKESSARGLIHLLVSI